MGVPQFWLYHIDFIIIFVIFTMRRKKILLFLCLFVFLFHFLFFYFKGEILYNSFVTEKKVKCTDSYDVLYLSTCYVQLLFRCHYGVGSSIDYQDSAPFQDLLSMQFFVVLAPQQIWSDSTCLLFRMLYVMNKSYNMKGYWW